MIEAYQHQFPTLAESDWPTLEDRLTGGLTQLANTLARSAILEERNRLAREIHDTVAQEFSGILLHLAAVGSLEGIERQNVLDCLTRARELARAGLEDTRRMLLGLRPKSLEGADLSDALAQLASRFAGDCGIACEFNERGPGQVLPENTEDELFRVVQEALCNVQKHSHARAASISLSYTFDVVELIIKDNGQGFATARRWQGAHGFGMPTMGDRVHRLGGKLEINSRPGKGTELRITVPIPEKTYMKRSRHEEHIDENHGSIENSSSGRGRSSCRPPWNHGQSIAST
jgi:signal transduction histidine kinase